MPVYSAKPPETPPIMRSVPLRLSWGRAGAPAGGGWDPDGGTSDGGAGGSGADVMPRACRAAAAVPIGEDPDPPLVQPSGNTPGPAETPGPSQRSGGRSRQAAGNVPRAPPAAA